ncbi:conserved hypothetical protein [Thiocapsa sp. KS1]|nr:hypothetical protein [Thiocapsa sp. KS1]CRI64998.1 conserved hypothetical protein [Thiocapsa sp. KS1]
MSNPKKIIDNPTSAELLKQFEAFESLNALFRAFPFARHLFPSLEQAFNEFKKIKKQAEILKAPDRFNERFASLGWIAYESMSMEVMQEAIRVYDTDGKDAAEQFLADSYDADCLEWGIRWFNGNKEFRRRMRLAELAREDYLAGRYHACVPLLLSMLDGLVNDVSKHVGFFAESTDVTAWDCIAAHESGLQALSALMTKGRNKTNEDPISIPFRHGILHGRELAFDNKLVAAKVWAALFAARDWAVALANGKKIPRPKEEKSWPGIFAQLSENRRQKNLLEERRPRNNEEIPYLPHEGDASHLPLGTPERAVAEFIENWIANRYGLIAKSLLYFTDDSLGKKSGRAKEDFGRRVPTSYKVISIEDQAAAVSHVEVELMFEGEGEPISKQASVRAIYQDADNDAMVRTEPYGSWKIVQNSFTDILYEIRL